MLLYRHGTWPYVTLTALDSTLTTLDSTLTTLDSTELYLYLDYLHVTIQYLYITVPCNNYLYLDCTQLHCSLPKLYKTESPQYWTKPNYALTVHHSTIPRQHKTKRHPNNTNTILYLLIVTITIHFYTLPQHNCTLSILSRIFFKLLCAKQ